MAINLGDGIFWIKSNTKGLETGLANVSNIARRAAVGLGIAGAAITAALGFATKAAADFEQAITNAAVVTGETGEALQETKAALGELAKELGRTTVFTASEAAEALGILARKGLDVVALSAEEMRPFLDLAASTMSDLAFATDLATETANAFGIAITDVGRVVDVLALATAKSALDAAALGDAMKFVAPVAGQAGQSLESVTAALGILAERGIKASLAGTALRRMMAELLSPSEKTAEILETVGLTAAGITKIFSQRGLIDALKALKVAGLSTGQAMQVFGQRAGPAALALSEFGKAGTETLDRVQALTAALEESGGAAERMAEEQLNTLHGRIKLLKSAIEAVVIPIGESLLPMLTKTAEVMGAVTRAIATWVEENPKIVQAMTMMTGAVGLALLGMAGLATAIWVFTSALKVLWPLLVTVGSALVSISLPAWVAIVAGIALVVGAIAVFRKAWAENWNGIRDKFYEIRSALLEKFYQLRSDLIGLWHKHKDKVKKNWDAIAKVIWEGMKSTWDKMKEFGTWVKEKFTEYWPTLKDSMVEVWETLKTKMEAILPRLISLMDELGTYTQIAVITVIFWLNELRIWFEERPAIIETAITSMRDVLKLAFKAIGTAVSTLLAVLQGDFLGVWDILKKAAVKALDEIGRRVDIVFGPGTWEKISNNIKDSLTPTFVWLTESWEKVQEAVEAVDTAIQSLITVMDGWEYRTVLNGLKAAWNAVKTVIQSVLDIVNNLITALVRAAMAAALAPTGPYGGGQSYATGTNYVPATGRYILHQGEAVIPRDQNPAANGSVASAGPTNTFNFIGPSREEMLEVIRMAQRTGEIQLTPSQAAAF